MNSLFTSPKPIIPIRALHLDLKGVPPTAQRLVGILPLVAACRYNALLVEWEDAFPWSDRRFRSPTAYSPDDVRRFAVEAGRLGIEIIPLVQCLGHMETPLGPQEQRPLRESPYRSDVLNPLAPAARALVEAMVDDVLALLPQVKHFHLGGDEAWSFGTHPDTKAYIAAHGKGALYLQHVEPILDKLLARNVRPILWHDMMRDWDEPALRRLAEKADLCVWGYSGHPDDHGGHHSGTAVIRLFKEHGIRLWAGTAYKGADGHDADLPVFEHRQVNALAWAQLAKEYGFVGAIATAWSRYSTNRSQCEPIDAALDCMVNVGVILHDGRPATGGAEACAASLEPGERQRFEACRAAMAALSAAKASGWQAVKNLRQQIVLSEQDTRRRGTDAATCSVRDLRRAIDAADTAATATRKAFAGLIEPVWIEQYLTERIEPLREELAELQPRAAALEPEAYAAIQP